MKTNETPTPTVCLIGIHLQFFATDAYPCSSLMKTIGFLRNGIKGFFSDNARSVYGADEIGEPLHPFLVTSTTSPLYDNEWRDHVGWAIVAVRPATVREGAFVADAAWSANAITKWLLEENPDVSFHTDVLIELNSGKQRTFLPEIKIH
jgi:hypothetical protein